MLQNLPEWMPFACLVTGKVIPKKTMITRIIEGALISVLASSITIYYGLPMAVAMLTKDVQQDRKILLDHIAWAQEQVTRRTADMDKLKGDTFRHDDEIIARLQRIENCLIVRTCGR